MEGYNHKETEKKWQERWEKDGLYNTPDKIDAKENFYTLVEFPYPSGNLHVGHWYAFAVPDIFARFKRMQGFNVLYPIGFDSFGLPAENAAIKRGLDPKEWTYSNIEYMSGQLKSMGNMFDWSRKVVTSDPEYYKWTQLLFIKLFENGLAYKKKGLVNWCPSCQTVLANEQVVEGTCERCGTEVTKKDLEQWYFKITNYAERLLEDLDGLDWPEPIKQSQRNWIGKSEGARIVFSLSNGSDITVFTTRPDTLFGATYIVLAPEHPIVLDVKSQILNFNEVEQYIQQTKLKTEIERGKKIEQKTGVELQGIDAKHPITGEKMSVWIADYVLMNYGTGAIMAVPAHDERDYVFAKHFNLPLKTVIERPESDLIYFHIDDNDQSSLAQNIRKCTTPKEHTTPTSRIYEMSCNRAQDLEDLFEKNNISSDLYEDLKRARNFIVEGDSLLRAKDEAYVGDGVHVNSDFLNGLHNQEAIFKMICWLEDNGKGSQNTTYKLRDWLLSRQRYWGCPIPVVYDPEGKPHPIPEEHLPWVLPTDDIDYTPKGTSPLGSSKELIERTEKIFGEGWRPEVDTMDTFVDSSWYFLRYCDPDNTTVPFDKLKVKNWMPVKRYSGGAEHTTMHLLYARFFHKALFDLKLVDEGEPFSVRMNRGLILGPDGQKMSKSKGNVVDPGPHVERVGSDTVKTYLAFIGPYNEVGQYPWDLGGIAGVRRFLERVWKLKEIVIDTHEDGADIQILTNKTIKKVTEDTENYKFNTAISQMMILVNELEKQKKVSKHVYEDLLRLLAPCAPHMTEELWEQMGNTTSIHLESWPIYDEGKLFSDMVTYAIQINGKVRGELSISRGAPEKGVVEQAQNDSAIKGRIEGKKVVKIVFVKERLINFVIEI